MAGTIRWSCAKLPRVAFCRVDAPTAQPLPGLAYLNQIKNYDEWRIAEIFNILEYP